MNPVHLAPLGGAILFLVFVFACVAIRIDMRRNTDIPTVPDWAYRQAAFAACLGSVLLMLGTLAFAWQVFVDGMAWS